MLYTDIHVDDASTMLTTGKTFPAECTTTTMTSAEKTMEYMLFDLDDCVAP